MEPCEEALKQLIAEYGIDAILESLEAVCYAKAADLRLHWQDKRYARAWEIYGERIGKVRPQHARH